MKEDTKEARPSRHNRVDAHTESLQKSKLDKVPVLRRKGHSTIPNTKNIGKYQLLANENLVLPRVLLVCNPHLRPMPNSRRPAQNKRFKNILKYLNI